MKPGTAKIKGRNTEQALVDYLRDRWGCLYVERRRLEGVADRGDIAGIPGVVLEVKSGVRVNVAGWLAELAAEQTNACCVHGAVVVRPKGRPNPAGWWAVMPLPQLLTLLDEAELLPRETS